MFRMKSSSICCTECFFVPCQNFCPERAALSVCSTGCAVNKRCPRSVILKQCWPTAQGHCRMPYLSDGWLIGPFVIPAISGVQSFVRFGCGGSLFLSCRDICGILCSRVKIAQISSNTTLLFNSVSNHRLYVAQLLCPNLI